MTIASLWSLCDILRYMTKEEAYALITQQIEELASNGETEAANRWALALAAVRTPPQIKLRIVPLEAIQDVSVWADDQAVAPELVLD